MTLTDYVIDGDLEKVKDFLVNGYIIHEDEKDILFWACANSKYNIVEYLIKYQGFKADENDSENIVMASNNGNAKLVKFLHENGADIHTDEEASLRLASSNGNIEVVKYLVENGANIHAKNDLAFKNACSHGHAAIVKYLISKGVNLKNIY